MKTNPVKQLLKNAFLLAVFLFSYKGLAQTIADNSSYASSLTSVSKTAAYKWEGISSVEGNYSDESNFAPVSCLTLSTTYTNETCSGYKNGAINLTVTGGASPYAYDWEGDGLSYGDATTSSDISGLKAGTYSVFVTSADGCTANTIVTIVSTNPTPTLTISGGTTICSSLTPTTLTGSGADTYSWSTGAITASITATVGNYTLYGMSTNGCASSEGVEVSYYSSETIVVSPTQTICEGQSATLIASGGVSYTWSPGGQTTSSITVSPTSSETYTVSATTACGNIFSTTTEVAFANTTSPAITLSGVSHICAGSSNTYTASVSPSGDPFTYNWSFGSNSSTNTDIVSGDNDVLPGGSQTLTVYAIDGSTGCSTNTASLTINNYSSTYTLAYSNEVPICSGTSYTIDAAVSSLNGSLSTYTWTPSLSGLNPVVTPSVSTTYTLAVSNAVCQTPVQATFYLQVDSTPVITLTSPVNVCTGTNYTVLPVISRVTTGTVYNWEPGTNLNTSSTATTVASVVNTQSYTLTVSNGYQYYIREVHQDLVCQAQAVITINALASPTLSISGNQIICPGQTTTLTASGASSYTWNTGITSPSITVGVGSTNGVPYDYSETYTVTGANANGCTNTTTITVSDPVPSIRSEAFSLYTNTVTLCSGTSYTFEVGLPGGETYTWTPALSGGLDPVVSPTVSTFYVLSVSNGTCTTNDTAFFYVIPTPTMSIISPVNLCPENSYTINPSLSGVNMNTIYSWSPTIALSSTNTPVTVATPTTSTTYSLIAVNTYTYESFDGKSHQNVQVSCFDTADATINIIPAPSAPAINNISVCDSNYTTLYVPLPNSTYTYTWQGPCFNGTGDSININSIGIYTVTVTNSCGVAITQTVNVLVIGNIVAGFLTNLHFTDGDEYLNSVHFSNISLGTNLTYDWSFGNGDSSMVPNPYETFNSVGVYMVSLFDSDSMHCKDTASATIIFSGNRSILAIPNSFSPNNDHVDDVFSVNAVDITNFSCQISDRWGNLLYQWNGLGGFWNGIMPNGHVFMNGNYYYLLSYSDSNGNPQSRTGIVTLKQ